MCNEHTQGSCNMQTLRLSARDDAERIRDEFNARVFTEFAAIATLRLSDDGVWEALERLAARLVQTG